MSIVESKFRSTPGDTDRDPDTLTDDAAGLVPATTEDTSVLVPATTEDAAGLVPATTEDTAVPVPATTEDAAVPVPATTEDAAGLVPATTGSTSVAAADSDTWRELQGRFVDDPAQVVRDAAVLAQGAIQDLSRELDVAGISTEDLRTVFRRLRDLHSDLVSWNTTA